MESFKQYNKEKADKTFGTLPYTVASDKIYDENLNRRLFYRKKQIVKSVVNVAYKFAAVLFIPLAVCTALYIYDFCKKADDSAAIADIPEQIASTMEYVTLSGTKGKIVLPDSTEVWINSCSRLKCPAKFDTLQRVVELSGEAYFKVRGNSHWPMYIKTDDIVTKVTGTEFNLSAYDNDSAIKLTLVNGKVEMLKGNDNRIELYPNEQASAFKGSKETVHLTKKYIADIQNEIAWKDGFLIFNNTPMTEVIKKMERWYGVTVKVTEQEILNYKFTARFCSESATQIMELLSISSNIRYTIDDSVITLYSKK